MIRTPTQIYLYYEINITFLSTSAKSNSHNLKVDEYRILSKYKAF